MVRGVAATEKNRRGCLGRLCYYHQSFLSVVAACYACHCLACTCRRLVAFFLACRLASFVLRTSDAHVVMVMRGLLPVAYLQCVALRKTSLPQKRKLFSHINLPSMGSPAFCSPVHMAPLALSTNKSIIIIIDGSGFQP